MTPAVEGPGGSLHAAELLAHAAHLASMLLEAGTRVLATLMDNSPAWVVADQAALAAGVVHVPLPAFFTPQQVGHALASAGVDTVLAAPLAAGTWVAPRQTVEVAGEPLVLVRLPGRRVGMPQGTAKVTFTSGSTGTPKGVCLRQDAMDAVAQGLVAALAPLDIRRHLCVLPFAVLLENIAGLLAPLARGATCVVPPLREVGLSGSSAFDPGVFAATVARHAPESVILLPQMLRAWVLWLQRTGSRPPPSLKLVAVGGAHVGAALLAQARTLGIPAYEGYGLSEGASVQALNLPGADRPGSAGRVLPHARLRVTQDGEIEIGGTLMAGYLGDAAPVPDWWPTGDLGRIDEDGFLHVQGRSSHLLVTGFGRNVSPEWVESALRDQPAVAHAAVFGEGQSALSAVLWPLADPPDSALQAAVDAANAALPDYARVRHWVRALAPYDAPSGMATANGRPCRGTILQRHAAALASGSPTDPIEETHDLLS